jgi:hemolysin activation/secretion protein
MVTSMEQNTRNDRQAIVLRLVRQIRLRCRPGKIAERYPVATRAHYPFILFWKKVDSVLIGVNVNGNGPVLKMRWWRKSERQRIRRRSRLLSTVWTAIYVFVADTASAQPPIGGGLEQIRPGEERIEEPQIRPERPPVLRPSPEVPIEPPVPAPIGPSFVMRDVRFEGNEALGDAELRAVVEEAAPLPRTVTTSDLEVLRRRLTRAYVDRGYINSGALLPDQDVVDGVVTFAIVEGALTDIRITGLEHLRSRYVMSRLERIPREPLNVNEVSDELRILEDDSLITDVRGRLGPGLRPGEAELEVLVEETPAFVGRVGFDNYRSTSVGELQGSFRGTFRNFVGWGEKVEVGLWKTSDFHDLIALVDLPVTAKDTTLHLLLRDVGSRVSEGRFDDLDIESSSQEISLAVSQPVWRRPGQALTLGLRFARRQSKTSLLGRPFSFSPGVQDGRSVVSALRFSQDFLHRGPGQVLAARSEMSFGLDAFGSTQNPGDIPDSSFFAWLGQAQWVRQLTEGGGLLVVRGAAQFTPDALLPVEKFSMGGFYTVRGYRESLLVRDNGWTASVEVRIPIFRFTVPGVTRSSGDGLVEFAPFFDFGRSWNRDVPTGSLRDLAGIGAGLRVRLNERIHGSVYFAHAIEDVPEPEDGGLQDDGIHFSLTASTF